MATTQTSNASRSPVPPRGEVVAKLAAASAVAKELLRFEQLNFCVQVMQCNAL